MRHPDSGIIAALTGCAPEQAQAALEALVANGWTPPSTVTLPAADPEVVEQAAPSASGDVSGKGVLTAHIDGACSGNPGPGGWAVVFSRGGAVVREYSDGMAATTNNRMELTAVLEAVRRAPKGSRPEILTDSNLVIGWLSKNFKRNDPTIRKLCAEIDALMAQRGPAGAVSFRHVRGHNGDALNERADRLATAAIEKVRPRAARE